MEDKSARKARQDALLEELEGIRDVYRSDVRQFIAFLREHKLHIVDGFKRYAAWLEGEHEGRRYSPATVNRKLAAARNRVRYAFKHSAFAADLRRKYQLEEVLKTVKLKKIDVIPVRSGSALEIEEARRLVGETKDHTIRLMVTLLVRTGARVSEMLGLKLTDIGTASRGLVPLRITGKGGKERTIHVETDFLDRLRKHFGGTTWLFEHNGRPYSRVSVTNRIKHEALRILGREVSAQQLRHTWAAIQIRKGRAVSAVAAALGHSNPGLAAQRYAPGELKPKEALLDLGTGDSEETRSPRAPQRGDGNRGSAPQGAGGA
jgi:integrase/recombinase XerD